MREARGPISGTSLSPPMPSPKCFAIGPQTRLVLFRDAKGVTPILDIEEFPAFRGLEDRIEWRNFVPLSRLPEEISQFDINIAPLEVGNPFCEAKSELKFFEAALVDVPTIASPTGPFRRAIRHGVTGFLAADAGQWLEAAIALVDDPALRHRMARAAHREVLWTYGPLRRSEAMAAALPLMLGSPKASARAFALELSRNDARHPPPSLPETEVVFHADRLGEAEVTVVVPLYNYANYIVEALDSVKAQTLRGTRPGRRRRRVDRLLTGDGSQMGRAQCQPVQPTDDLA